MPPMTGRVIAGRYSLQQPIGRGAMGVVWRARDQLLDRDVAVKEVLITALIGEDERRNAYQRTLREARTAARLSHRGVVAVYDVAEEDGRPWIVMELIEARSLDQVLTVDGRLSPLRAGRMGQQVLSALAHAHACGVLHRDVKPSNVLIARERSGPGGWDERAVLTDFGIAQFEGDPRLTQTGMVMGSPGFTAPERIRGGQAGPASDLWSLGATLFTAVEGRGPYDSRGGPITTMSAIIHEDAPAAVHAGRLGPLIAALLRRDPATRPSALAAARLFADVLPLLAEPASDRAATHPPTIRSAHVPAPAEPVASTAAPTANESADEVARRAAPEAAAVAVAAAAVAAPAAPVAVPASAVAIPASAVAVPAAAVAEDAAAEVPAETVGKAADAQVPAAADEAGDAEAGDAAADGDLDVGNLEVEDLGVENLNGEMAAAAETVGPDADSDAAADAGADGAAQHAGPEGAVAASGAGTQAPVNDAPGSTGAGAERASAVTVIPDMPGRAVESQASPPSAETRIDREPVREQTAVSVPSARSAPPAVLKPTFTAANPADRRPAPSFSSAQVPPPAAPPTAAPPTAAQPGYGAPAQPGPPHSGAGASHGGPVSSGTMPFAGSGTQYAGPSAPQPDLARQYPMGTGGGRARRQSHRGRWILLLAVAVVLAAAIGAMAAVMLNHRGSGSPSATSTSDVNAIALRPTVAALDDSMSGIPDGWTKQTISAAKIGTTAGFSIGVPPGWTVSQQGLVTRLDAPDNAYTYLEVDLTKHTYQDMVAEARFIKRGSLAAGELPGYNEHLLIAQQVRGTAGGFWQFTTVPGGGAPKLRADDILFILNTQAGSQSYAIFFRSPDSLWQHHYIPIFEEILRTFHPVPGQSS